MDLCTGGHTLSEMEAKTITVAPFNLLAPRNEDSISQPSTLTEVLNSALHIKESEPPFFGTNMPLFNTTDSAKSSRSSSPKNCVKQATVLPPCRVCGDNASGFHYGAYTCEACKVFFRRSLKKAVPYRCSKGGNCQIMPHKRLTCSYCRLKKCGDVGMSKQSIKRGRYTLEKKTDCIREVKLLQQRKSGGHKPPSQNQNQVVPDNGLDLNLETAVELSPGYGLDLRAGNELDFGSGHASDISQGSLMDFSPESGYLSAEKVSDLSPGKVVDFISERGLDLTTDKGLDLTSGHKVDLSPDSASTEFQDLTVLYDEVIKKLTRNSEKFNSYSKQILDNIEASHTKHLADLKAVEEVFGPLRLLSQDEFNDLYNCTGIDVDGRRSEISTHLPNLEERLQHMVGFAKTLPGFKDFLVEDQISLIKASGFDYFMLLSFAAMNVENRLYTCGCGHTRSDKELGRIINMEMVDEMFNTAKYLQKIDLTPEELALIKAYCILSPDRCELNAREKVEKAHSMIYECMMYYFLKHRADDEGFFGRLTNTLLSIRNTTYMHEVHILSLLTNFPNLDFPPLLLELLAS